MWRHCADAEVFSRLRSPGFFLGSGSTQAYSSWTVHSRLYQRRVPGTSTCRWNLRRKCTSLGRLPKLLPAATVHWSSLRDCRVQGVLFCLLSGSACIVNGLHFESSVCIIEISPALSFAFVIIFGRRHRVEEIGTAVKRCHSIDTLNRPSNRPWYMISVLQRLEDEKR